MIINKVLEAANPYLEERFIKDAVIGLSLIGIELDNGDIGLSYMLREDLPPGCSAFSFAQDIIGANAYELGRLVKDGEDDAQRGVGIAVLTAASCQQDLIDIEDTSAAFGVDVLPTDTVGMVGYIEPIAKRLSNKVKKLYVFDSGVDKSKKQIDCITETENQPKLLPECDVALITGTTIVNGSIDNLLGLCKNAREIVLVGSSTPMFPEAFKDTNVTVLAGAWWDKEDKDKLFKLISIASGISHVRDSMIKKAVRVMK